MNLKNVAICFSMVIAFTLSLHAQQTVPTSGEVTVQLSEPIDFATARPLQAVRSVVVSSSNPAIAAGSFAVLQLQNRDGSYTLKLLRINAGGQVLKTMSQPGVSVGGAPASGQHASLPNGATVRFTLTQQDGSPGAPLQQGASPVKVSAPSHVASKPEYILEGIGLGMTRAQVQAAAKEHGSVGGLKSTGNGYEALKTSDLSFDSVQFNDSGVVWSYTVSALNPKHLKVGNASGPLYELAVAAFGPAVVADGSAKWGVEKVGSGNAMYSYDKSEAPNGDLVVSNGLQ